VVEESAHELLSDAGPAASRDDADAAHPRSLAAAAEVREADRRPVLDRDQRVGKIEVEDVDHEGKRLLVD
jgi:hypothetical protein